MNDFTNDRALVGGRKGVTKKLGDNPPDRAWLDKTTRVIAKAIRVKNAHGKGCTPGGSRDSIPAKAVAAMAVASEEGGQIPAPSVYRRHNRDRRISHGAFRLWHCLRDHANATSIIPAGQRSILRQFHAARRRQLKEVVYAQ